MSHSFLTNSSHTEDDSLKIPEKRKIITQRKFFWTTGILAIIVVGVLIFFWRKEYVTSPSASSWQAVFLDNNQVYFGHLSFQNKTTATLKNVFYFKIGSPLQQVVPNQTPLSLVKLGSEVHGPEDVLYINPEKIVFWENLRSDSQVVKVIGGANGQ